MAAKEGCIVRDIDFSDRQVHVGLESACQLRDDVAQVAVGP